MNKETAVANYALLKNGFDTKLCVDAASGGLSLDTRWFPSLRRYATGDSRWDLDDPLRKTFIGVIGDVSQAELKATTLQAEKSLRAVYPDDEDHWHAFFTQLQEETSVEYEHRRHPSTPALNQNCSTATPRQRLLMDAAASASISRVAPPPPELSEIRIDMKTVSDDFEEEKKRERRRESQCILFQWFPCLISVRDWFERVTCW